MDYRKEIDGLRALAVVPVIMFHAGFPAYSGGFVGVDVFFVISGYLITRIIAAELSTGQFSIVNFYERRARRILPALFFTLALTLPFAWLWLFPEELQSYAQSLIAVSTFSSNILFWLTSGYFDTASELKPLLHTWSLAVEEQYYVFFPLLLACIWRFGKQKILLILLGIALISLLLSEWGAAHKPMATFYLLPTRGWELLVGALCSFYHTPQALKGRPALANSLAILGLGMVLAAIFLYSPYTQFPGFNAVLPTSGAALIILFATGETWTGQLLGKPFFVGIGLISYSAYLWHHVLFAFARQRSIDYPSVMLYAWLTLATFVLAFITWKFIETPFRNKNRFNRRQIFLATAAGTFCFIVIGVTGMLNHGFPDRNATFHAAATVKSVDKDSFCHLQGRRSIAQLKQGDFCMEGAHVQPSFAVIGDSHAGAIFEQLGQLGKQKNFAFYAVSGPFCAPMLNLKLSAFQGVDCQQSIQLTYDHIIHQDHIKTVVLMAEWANYIEGTRNDGGGQRFPAVLISDELGKANTPAENKRVFERTLIKSIHTLQAAGKQVIIVLPVPEFERRVAETVYKIQLFGGDRSQAPTLSLQHYLARNAGVFEVFNRVPDIQYIDPRQLFCNATLCRSTDPDGHPLYSDTNHVNQYGAMPIAEKISDRIPAHP